MPSLMLFFLHLGNNSINIDGSQFDVDNNFPNLVDLYLNGNHLINFPDKSLKIHFNI